MTGPPFRAVSVLLVAILATLASADVLCLLPCEVAAVAHHDTAGVPTADHCGGATPSSSGGSALTASPDSCAGQHAWDGPAANRTVARTSVEPAIVAISLTGEDGSIALRSDGLKPGSAGDPPRHSVRTSAPLRI